MTRLEDQIINYCEIVGKENVITKKELLEKYSKDQSFITPRMPTCVVRPKTQDEVINIIRMVNREQTVISSVGSSFSNNQGAAVPVVPGMTLDLSRMDKILEVDDRAWMVSIEPGVTFKQLQSEMKKRNLRVLTPVEMPSSASVLTTYLEYVPLFSWSRYGEYALSTLSVVLPTGELFKTGQQANASIAKPYVTEFGAPLAGLMSYIWYGSQGTLGVATQGWVKVKAMRESNKVFFIPLENLANLTKILHDIKWIRVDKELFMMDNMDLALLLAKHYPADVENLRKTLPKWTLVLTIRGPPDEVEFQELDLKDVVEKLKLRLIEDLPGVKNAGDTILSKIEYPEGWVKWSQFKGARNVLPFVTPIRHLPTYNSVIDKLAEKHGFPRSDIGRTMIPADMGRVHYQFSFARNPNSAKETETVKKLYYEAASALMTEGAFFSRPYGPIAEMVYARAMNYHTWIGRFKKVIDPNNILSPGKFALA